MTIKTSSLGGGTEIGQIVQDARFTTNAGNVLLPISKSPRPLTATEQAAYPVLTAALPDRWGVTNTMSSHNEPALNFTVDAKKIAATSDGVTMFYGHDHRLKKFDAVSGGETILFTGVSSNDNILNVDVSADGVTIAALYQTNASTLEVIVSNDSGAGFTTVFTSAVTGNHVATSYSALKVSADGDTVTWLTQSGAVANHIEYNRIDGALASLVVDVTSDVNLLVSPATPNCTRLQGGITDDGQSMFFAYRDGNTGLHHTNYSNDGATSFSELKPPSLDPIGNGGTTLQIKVDIDTINSDILLAFSTSQGNIGSNISMSADAGVSWQELPSMTEFTFKETEQSGDIYFPQNVLPAKCTNGHLFLSSFETQLMYYYIDAAKNYVTKVGMVFEQISQSSGQQTFYGIGISDDGLSGGICCMFGNSEVPYTNGKMVLGATLPAAGNSANMKVVADAP